MFVITDWANNIMPWGAFQSFDDAWDYLFNKFPCDDLKPCDEQDLQEYYVEKIGDWKNERQVNFSGNETFKRVSV